MGKKVRMFQGEKGQIMKSRRKWVLMGEEEDTK